MFKKLINIAKQNFYNYNFHKHRNNIKQTWDTINNILGKSNSREYIDHIIINNNKITEKQQIVDQFNSYFCNIANEMANNITIPLTGSYKDYLTNKFHASFSFKSVNKLDIHRIINNLSSKNTSGHDEISSVLLKKLVNILPGPITTIINQSLKSGIFPDNLKIAKISLIFKKGDHHQIENYRPISLLPTISKIFEKVVFIQLYDFFSENNFLYTSQYGFSKKPSTELAALETVDILLNKLDNKQTPAAIFIDLSKAFDTIDHQILLNKLSYYGIKNTALKWFTNYLFARSQYVEINSQKSSKIKISTGIPQGFGASTFHHIHQ